MPTYNNDPTKVAASFAVLPKDSYELIIGTPKAFFKGGQNGKADNYGIRCPLTVATGQFAGTRGVPANLYQHTQDAESYSKQFIMAALGYDKGRDEERRFDNDMKGADWSFDTDTGAVGDAWRQLEGKRIIGDYDVKLGDNQQEQQNVLGWRRL